MVQLVLEAVTVVRVSPLSAQVEYIIVNLVTAVTGSCGQIILSTDGLIIIPVNKVLHHRCRMRVNDTDSLVQWFSIGCMQR